MKLGYSDIRHMKEQLKNWTQDLDKRLDGMRQTGEGFKEQLNEVERNLYELLKRGPNAEDSKVHI